MGMILGVRDEDKPTATLGDCLRSFARVIGNSLVLLGKRVARLGGTEHEWVEFGEGHECSYVDCYCDHPPCVYCGVEQGMPEAEEPCYRLPLESRQ